MGTDDQYAQHFQSYQKRYQYDVNGSCCGDSFDNFKQTHHLNLKMFFADFEKGFC